ncbi:MAG: ribulose-phosphate 3-epimerase, partial [Limnochordales bacterium]
VNPGFGGQKYLPEAAAKLPAARELCRSLGVDVELQVDGGIDRTTLPQAVKAGATVLVAGTAVFAAPDPTAALDELQRLAQSASAGG